MDLRDLTYLATAGPAGSFTEAARTLGLTCSTVSRGIARLEDELGVTLFERSNSGIRLTDAGHSVMVEVRRALDDVAALSHVGQIRGQGQRGLVRLGLRMPPLGEPIQSLLAGWHEASPDVALTVVEMNDNDLRAAFTNRRVDAALIPRHALWPSAHALPVYTERICAALPVAHALCNHSALTWALLKREPVLTQEWDGSHTAREYFASFLGSGVDFRAHAASKQSILALVAAGFGITLVTEGQSTIAFPGVVFRPIDEGNACLHVDLTWVPGLEDPVVGRFIAFVRDGARHHKASSTGFPLSELRADQEQATVSKRPQVAMTTTA
jgi:DNA-binding transcriptional LysR family regulator